MEITKIQPERIAGFDFEKMCVLLSTGKESQGKPVYEIEPLDQTDKQVIVDAFLDWRQSPFR